ncbi:hypothetical protein EMIT07CA2_10009 [Brevibacillus sp. IT-7CA2]
MLACKDQLEHHAVLLDYGGLTAVTLSSYKVEVPPCNTAHQRGRNWVTGAHYRGM